jgi:hypothetical protein
MSRRIPDPAALIAGVAFTGIGLAFLVGEVELADRARWVWPIVLVSLGAGILVAALRGQGEAAADTGATDTVATTGATETAATAGATDTWSDTEVQPEAEVQPEVDEQPAPDGVTEEDDVTEEERGQGRGGAAPA